MKCEFVIECVSESSLDGPLALSQIVKFVRVEMGKDVTGQRGAQEVALTGGNRVTKPEEIF